MATNNITDITFTNIIDNSPNTNSSGYFKELMQSVSGFINGEYQDGRITGTDYANVYLGALQYALQNATQYALQKEVQNQQAELLAAQTDGTLANTEADTALKASQKLAVDSDKDIKKDQSDKDLLVKAAQITSMGVDDSLKTAQKASVESEKVIKEAQAGKDLSVKDAQIVLTNTKNESELKQQNVLDAQVGVYTNQAKAFKAKHNKDILSEMSNIGTVMAGLDGLNTVLAETAGTNGSNIKSAYTAAKDWPTSV